MKRRKDRFLLSGPWFEKLSGTSCCGKRINFRETSSVIPFTLRELKVKAKDEEIILYEITPSLIRIRKKGKYWLPEDWRNFIERCAKKTKKKRKDRFLFAKKYQEEILYGKYFPNRSIDEILGRIDVSGRIQGIKLFTLKEIKVRCECDDDFPFEVRRIK